jgi:hypothetical protein
LVGLKSRALYRRISEAQDFHAESTTLPAKPNWMTNPPFRATMRAMILRLTFRAAACATILCAAGCVTPPKPTTDVLSETDEERAHRKVFKDDWWRPSVTKEDYDFFYKGFFWGGR